MSNNLEGGGGLMAQVKTKKIRNQKTFKQVHLLRFKLNTFREKKRLGTMSV